jgi:hypothetical protein
MTWIEIDKELEWVTAWDEEDRHVGVISKHECVVDVEWVEELLTQVKRLRLDLASGRITTIVNPNDDHNRTLYVTIEFPDGEVYRGYVEKEGEEE